MELSRAVFSSMGKIAFATTNNSLYDVGLEDLDVMDKLWICYDRFKMPNKPNSPLQMDEKNTLYQYLLSVVYTLSTTISQNLKMGSHFHHSEKFHSVDILRLSLSQLSGLKVTNDFINIEFPHQWHGNEFIPLIFEEVYDQNATLKSTGTPLSLVIFSFMNNIFDPEQPSNFLTISINLYMDDGRRLEWNSHEKNNLQITVKPLQEKAKLFWQQKIYAQCNVNEIKCHRAENAHRLGTLVVFPVIYEAGPFMLMIPIRRLEFSYKAYININSLPTPQNYVWLFSVDILENGTRSTTLIGGGALGIPNFIDNGESDTKILIPYETLKELGDLLSPDDIGTIQVVIQEDFSSYGDIYQLPDVACEFHSVYGYQLHLIQIGTVGQMSKLKRRRRAALEEDETSINVVSSETSVNVQKKSFGEFGIHISIAPNRIQFVDLYRRFSLEQYNNIPVLMFLTFLITFCCILTIWAYFMDKRDLKMWSYRPIVGNRYFENVNYLVTVHYGRIKHKKLGPKVSICLLGDVQDTIWKELTDNSENVSISIFQKL